MNVTIPFKQTVIPFLDQITSEAQKIGAVNTIIRRGDKLFGHNTDYFGFQYLLRRMKESVAGAKVIILGSGGTSKTVSAVCSDMGAASIIRVSRAQAPTFDDLDRYPDADVIINTTPVGMFPNMDQTLIHIERFPRCRSVVDVIYNPLATRLIQEARAAGKNAGNGLPMLAAQAKAAAELFLGKELPAENLERTIRKIDRDTRNIIMIGMPGSGKSTVGKMVAERMGRNFIDIDELITREIGMSIPAYFSRFGEPAFRSVERELTAKAGGMKGQVIATGGGCVMNEQNRRSLRYNGIIIYLDRSLEKLPVHGRPVSQRAKSLQDLLTERKPYYLSMADLTADNNGSLTETAESILHFIKQEEI